MKNQNSRLANNKPASEAISTDIQIVTSCKLGRVVRVAEMVAGIIRYANTTTTTPIWTDNVITMPSRT